MVGDCRSMVAWSYGEIAGVASDAGRKGGVMSGVWGGVKRWLVGISLLGHWVSPGAMTLERVGDTLYATGAVGGDDYLLFKQHLSRPGLRRLALVESPGGDLWTALRVGEIVREGDLDTVAVGKCISACSVIFVAGKNRSFGLGRSPGTTLLGVHGGYNKDSGRYASGVGPSLYAFFRRQIGVAMNDGLINEAIYGFKDARGLLILRETERNSPEVSEALLCLNMYETSTCKRQAGKDAFTVGLVTQRATVALDLPPSMQLQLTYFGQTVEEEPFDFQKWTQEVRPLFCRDRDCSALENALMKFSEAPGHRAIAWDAGLASDGPATRLQFTAGASTPELAVVQALMGCNQSTGKPKLCRVLSLDDQDLRPMLERQLLQTLAADLQLPSVSSGALAEERKDFCGGEVSQRKSLERESYGTAAPCGLVGVERIDTSELVQMLKNGPPPIVVDVSTSAGMVPGAIALLGAGLSFDDPVKEAELHQRFEGLLRSAAPDASQPLVFYGGDRGGWLSANGALRAVQVGFTRVYWYRGGLPAWTAVGLPTVGKVAQGVVY